VHRIGRDGGSITNPHLVINTSVQPKVWKEIIGDENAIGRGAVGRFLVFNVHLLLHHRHPNRQRIHILYYFLHHRHHPWQKLIRQNYQQKY
jgi:hypothetical protein